ncbi:hypothetical protein RMI40_31830 [Pseudomonas protegens]|uniref:hypothetical protein n=1 Tax=Pseudomonas protegens TaxID=380021 RepID=UPI00287E4A2F|nr:hypothetical protein [Pseudomonas protegens]MDS9879430.1 hypothetical protein [Pseudomonas protegens]
MGIAQEIDQLYSAYEAKLSARQMAVRKVASDIKDGLVKYVGLNPNARYDDDGKFKGPRIDIGIGQGKDFKSQLWTTLPIGRGGAVEFAISYWLLGQFGDYLLTFDCSVVSVSAGYEVSIDKVSDAYVISKKDAAEGGFSDLYALMIGALKSKIDPELIYVH